MKRNQKTSKTREYYDSLGHGEWERLARPDGQIEFSIFSRHIEKYLKRPSVILDIGGGPGRYSIHLAKQRHQLVLGDASPVLIDIARQKVAEAGLKDSFLGIDVLNILNLSRFKKNSFDALLVMGPFYHLTTKKERDKAIAESHRVLKKGGFLFVTAHTVYTWLNHLAVLAADKPERVPAGTLKALHQKGLYHNPAGKGFNNGFMFQVDAFKAFISSHGFKILDVVSSRGIARGIENQVSELKAKRPAIYKEFEKILMDTANDPNLLSFSGQILLIARKK